MIREYSKYKPFRFWCQKVLPLVYDDSLSYYELLNKVVDYLNNVIKDVNALGTAFEELDAMVNDYFDNLDVQEEINNKLDSMAEDGTLDAMIQPLVGDAVSEWLEDNVTPTGSAVLVDTTLTISGAAADAKVTGDEISGLKSDIDFYNFAKFSGRITWDTVNKTLTVGTGYVIYPGGYKHATSAQTVSYDNFNNLSALIYKDDKTIAVVPFNALESGHALAWFEVNKVYCPYGYENIYLNGSPITTANIFDGFVKFVDKANENIDQLISTVGLISKDTVEQGAWSATNTKTNDAKRIRFGQRIKVNVGDVVTIKNNLYAYLRIFETETEGESVIESIGWVNCNGLFMYSVDNDGYLTIMFANGATYGTSEEITPSDYYGVTYVATSAINNNEIGNILDFTGTDYALIPDYWKTHMATKLPTIQNHVEECGISGDSFIFLTDYHYSGVDGGTSGNCGYSHYLVKHIIANTSIKMFVNGGDMINGSSSKETATEYMRVVSKRFHGINQYSLRGNHDYNLNDGGSASVMLSDSLFYSLFIKDVEDKIVTDGTRLDYYHDNNVQKIRYIFMDSRYENNTGPGLITDDQINWMSNRITELSSGWSVVIFIHQYFASISSQPSTPTPENPPIYRAGVQKVHDKLVELYGNTNANIVGVISGHVHNDYSYDGCGFLEIATTTDSTQAHDTGFERGTSNEHAFDVFSLDLESKTLIADRVGRGNSRSWQYQ